MKSQKIKLIIIILVSGVLIFPSVTFARHRDSSYSSLSKKIKKLDDEVAKEMPIPVVFGVEPVQLIDTYNDARSGGRVHEAIDIFAPRGALVASPTEAVVTKIADQGLGGIQVWTANPGREEYYFAHLNAVYENLEVGDELEVGDLIGFVGNTGNASGGSTHLHFAIYSDNREMENPYPRLVQTFDTKDRVSILIEYIEYLQDLLKEIKKKEEN